jgi:hypothetical protein
MRRIRIRFGMSRGWTEVYQNVEMQRNDFLLDVKVEDDEDDACGLFLRTLKKATERQGTERESEGRR